MYKEFLNLPATFNIYEDAEGLDNSLKNAILNLDRIKLNYIKDISKYNSLIVNISTQAQVEVSKERDTETKSDDDKISRYSYKGKKYNSVQLNAELRNEYLRTVSRTFYNNQELTAEEKNKFIGDGTVKGIMSSTIQQLTDRGLSIKAISSIQGNLMIKEGKNPDIDQWKNSARIFEFPIGEEKFVYFDTNISIRDAYVLSIRMIEESMIEESMK